MFFLCSVPGTRFPDIICRGELMLKTRRQFLTRATKGLLGAAVASCSRKENTQKKPPEPATAPPPGAPPAFGTAPDVGPEVSAQTFAEAEKMVNIQLTDAERKQAAGNWRKSMAPLYERRTGPRQVAIDSTVAPYSRWDPILPGEKTLPQRDRFVWTKTDPGPLPSRDEDIAFAAVTQLAGWIQKRQLTSERLTQIYLERIKRLDPKLRCVITLTSDLALAQAKKADQEIAAGRPLLAAVVVSEKTGMPGAGLFKYARRNGLQKTDDVTFFVSELKRVYDYWVAVMPHG